LLCQDNDLSLNHETKNKMKQQAKNEAQRIINYNPFPVGSLGYKLTEANLKYHGYYATIIDGVKTFIEK